MEKQLVQVAKTNEVLVLHSVHINLVVVVGHYQQRSIRLILDDKGEHLHVLLVGKSSQVIRILLPLNVHTA